jgi:SAM-dependent methyltransferase
MRARLSDFELNDDNQTRQEADETRHPYGDDLAYIHDAGHGDFARSAAPGLLKFLHNRGITAGLVIDLGCGTGIWAKELVRAGYAVLGLDISPSMIALARKRVPAAQFRTESLLTATLPECVAVTSIGECFNYLFDAANCLELLARLFRRIHEALQPGGLLVFDILEPGCLRGTGLQRRFREGRDWAVLSEIEADRKRARLTRRITTFRRVGKLYRRGNEIHRQQLYRGSEIAEELRRAGFGITRLRGYGQLRFRASHIGFLAVKPGHMNTRVQSSRLRVSTPALCRGGRL